MISVKKEAGIESRDDLAFPLTCALQFVGDAADVKRISGDSGINFARMLKTMTAIETGREMVFDYKTFDVPIARFGSHIFPASRKYPDLIGNVFPVERIGVWRMMSSEGEFFSSNRRELPDSSWNTGELYAVCDPQIKVDAITVEGRDKTGPELVDHLRGVLRYVDRGDRKWIESSSVGSAVVSFQLAWTDPSYSEHEYNRFVPIVKLFVDKELSGEVFMKCQTACEEPLARDSYQGDRMRFRGFMEVSSAANSFVNGLLNLGRGEL